MRARPGGHAAAATLLLLAACGGGSSGTSPEPIAITFGPASLTATLAQGSFALPLPLTVSLSRVPDGTVYVLLALDQPVLASTTLTVTQTGPSSFSTSLTPSCNLAPGSHTGNMTLRLCSDPACAAQLPLTGNVLPYAFTVNAGHVMTARVGGVAVPGIISQCTPQFLSARVGSLVELVSSVPVTWDFSIGTSAGVPVVSGVTTTSTTWSGTVSDVSGGNIPGVFYGVVLVHATPAGGPTLQASISVNGG